MKLYRYWVLALAFLRIVLVHSSAATTSDQFLNIERQPDAVWVVTDFIRSFGLAEPANASIMT